MSYSVYILKCADKTLYTGFTKNIAERLYNHNHTKAGAKYTRARRPVKLVYSETFKTVGLALKREAEIKRLTRSEKLQLLKKIKRPKYPLGHQIP